ncbi:dinucleotide-utilizing enzyme [Microbacterium sp. NPDC076911]|uniref:dinucleotide-utilizing enzyme n=1 Tax=Microbacterium sp. NPDC076911 TaxID=3154958 RepID=UPI0034255333
MNTRPALVRSIPFWALIVASLASLAYGVSLVTDKIAVMTVTLTEGTATGVEVYVGQSIAFLGSILVGVGVLGLLIALAIAAASTLRAHPPVEVVEPIDWNNQDEVAVDEPAAYEPDPVVEVAEPLTDAEPVVAESADEVIIVEAVEPAAEQTDGNEPPKN